MRKIRVQRCILEVDAADAVFSQTHWYNKMRTCGGMTNYHNGPQWALISFRLNRGTPPNAVDTRYVGLGLGLGLG